MSGRKHHFIPQLYLRGFLVPGGGERVWQYRRTADAPLLSPIRNVAAQRDFYGSPNLDGTPSLDDAITVYEAEIDRQTKFLRLQPDGPIQDSRTVATLVAHLIVRSRHVRETMKGFVGQAIESLRSIITDSENLRRWLGLDAENFDPNLEHQLELALIASGAERHFNLKLETLKRYTRYLVREQFDIYHPVELRRLTPQMEILDDSLDQTADQTHLKILGDSLSPEQRVEVLASMTWSIRSATDGPLILPDCVGLSVSRSGDWRPALFVEQMEQAGFVVPLDHQRCLVGVSSSDVFIDLSTYNNHAAACSSEFFVASCDDPAFIELKARIGTVVNAQIEEMIAKASEDALADLNMNTSQPDAMQPSASNAALIDDSINFHFEGVQSREDAEAIAEESGSLVGYFSRSHAVSFLHGITYATDLRAAADNLADKFGGNPVYPSESDLFSSAAIYQPVPGDEHEMLRPIIHMDFGYGLISEDKSFRRASAATLFSGLAAASLMQIRHEAFPDGIGETSQNALQHRLLEDGAEGFSTYYSTRVSAFLLEESLGSFEDELITLLERAAIGMAWAYERYAEDDQVDTVYRPAVAISSSILLTAARIAARIDAVDPMLKTPEGLLDRLRPFGLDMWFLLLRRDLAETFARLPEHTERDLLITVPHFERLLWAMGVVPERTEDGRVWVDFRMMPGLGT